MFFYIVLTPISTTSGLWSTGNTRKYHQIDVYIYQCVFGFPITFETTQIQDDLSMVYTIWFSDLTQIRNKVALLR